MDEIVRKKQFFNTRLFMFNEFQQKTDVKKNEHPMQIVFPFIFKKTTCRFLEKERKYNLYWMLNDFQTSILMSKCNNNIQYELHFLSFSRKRLVAKVNEFQTRVY